MQTTAGLVTHEAPSSGGQKTTLWIILLFALLIRLAIAFRLPSVFYPDEIFQTVEIGHRFAFGNAVVSWEWHQGVRSPILPWLLSLVMRATVWMGPGSSGYLGALRVLMCLLSLTSVWFCYRWAQRSAGTVAGVLAGVAAAVWFILLFFTVKTFNEVFAADCFFPGLLLGAERSNSPRGRLVASGLLLGASVALRVQMLPTAVVAALWIVWPDLRKGLMPMALGFAAPLLLFGLVDAVTLGYPFASFVRYVWFNVGKGKSTQWGTEPWYWFLQKLIVYCWPLLIPALFGLRRSPILGWLLLALVGSHSVLAHKEFRFIYAALPLIFAAFGVGCADLFTRLRVQPGSSTGRLVLGALLFVIILSSTLMGRRFTHWHDFAHVLQAEDQASHDNSVCGVGLYKLSWAWTGGYTHLHRQIPLIVVPSSADLPSDARQINLLIAPQSSDVLAAGFLEESCRFGTCTYRRPGPCAPAGRDEINQYLARIGQ